MGTARTFLVIAGALGFVGVAAGAFGAHALRSSVDPDLLNAYETGVRYQMYHVFALALAAWGFSKSQNRSFSTAGWLFVAGVALFSGSLYIMTLTGQRWMGAITPFGGISLLGGWLFLVRGFWSMK